MAVPPRSARGGGRHFLRSSRLARQLIAAAGIRRDDLVVDVGAGAGALTAALAATGARVIAVELDPAHAAQLRDRFGSRPNVELVTADARTLRWPPQPFKVVANLPFGAANEILRSLLEPPVALEAADVVLQWETARKRATLWPSTVATAYWGAWHDLRLVQRLPACVFSPPPSVDAGVLRVRRLPQPLVPITEHRRYHELLQRAFATARPVRALLPRRAFDALAAELGLDRAASARDLDARQWAAVFDAVRRDR